MRCLNEVNWDDKLAFLIHLGCIKKDLVFSSVTFQAKEEHFCILDSHSFALMLNVIEEYAGRRITLVVRKGDQLCILLVVQF